MGCFWVLCRLLLICIADGQQHPELAGFHPAEVATAILSCTLEKADTDGKTAPATCRVRRRSGKEGLHMDVVLVYIELPGI